MTVKPRTIDNLGIETSRRYARDKEQLQESKELIENLEAQRKNGH